MCFYFQTIFLSYQKIPFLQMFNVDDIKGIVRTIIFTDKLLQTTCGSTLLLSIKAPSNQPYRKVRGVLVVSGHICPFHV